MHDAVIYSLVHCNALLRIAMQQTMLESSGPSSKMLATLDYSNMFITARRVCLDGVHSCVHHQQGIDIVHVVKTWHSAAT